LAAEALVERPIWSVRYEAWKASSRARVQKQAVFVGQFRGLGAEQWLQVGQLLDHVRHGLVQGQDQVVAVEVGVEHEPALVGKHDDVTDERLVELGEPLRSRPVGVLGRIGKGLGLLPACTRSRIGFGDEGPGVTCHEGRKVLKVAGD